MTATAFQDIGYGIVCVDSGYHRPQLAACYLIIEENQAAFIDTGTYFTVPRLLQLLEASGLSTEDVKYVMPTHVHLDHAGGAGRLMSALPNAWLVAHPYGAKHLIDPARLTAGTIAVYGEHGFRDNFGELLPVPEERVIIAKDGMQLSLNGRKLLLLDTPGHARHHYCVYDQHSEGIFTGDTFGISYPELICRNRQFIFPTTTPVQFDPDVWMNTLDRLMALQPKRAFLTHFGMIEGLMPYADELRSGIRESARIALKSISKSDRYNEIHRGLRNYLHASLQSAGCSLSTSIIDEIIELDLDLNTQGLEVWLDRQASSKC